MQSKRRVAEERERLLARGDGRRLDVVVADELDDALALAVVVLDDDEVLDAAIDEAAEIAEGLLERLLRGRLLQEGHGAELEARACRWSSAEMMWMGMWRVLGVVLEAIEDRPAVGVGQPQVERDGGGLVLAREREARVALERDDDLEAARARRVAQDAREVRIVLDDEQHAVAELELRRDRRRRAATTTIVVGCDGRLR